MNKTIVVTGSAGFIGSHIAEHYLEKQYCVIGIDNYVTGTKKNTEYLSAKYNQFYFLEMDVSQQYESIQQKILSLASNAEFVFHFASPASPSFFDQLAFQIIWCNSIGLTNFLQIADHLNAKLVFASSSEIYGDPLVSNIPETYRGNVNSFGERSCYDEAKRIGETIIYSHNKKYKTQHGVVRIFNTYGPRLNLTDGRVISQFAQNALSNEEIVIHGSGLQTRSFCYIDDFITGLDLYSKSSVNFPINIGNSEEIDMLGLAQTIIKITGSKSKLIFTKEPNDNPKKRKPDLTQSLNLLGYQPKVNLNSGLLKTIEWMRNN